MLKTLAFVLAAGACLPSFAVDQQPAQQTVVTPQALSNYLVKTRNAFLPTSAPVPVPDIVKQRMAKHFPLAVLNATHYVVSSTVVKETRAVIDHANLHAVTLLDLIAFQSRADVGDLGLWANQLQRVSDYLERGQRTMVTTYLSHPTTIDGRANAAQQRAIAEFGTAPIAFAPAVAATAAPGETAKEGAAPLKFMVHSCRTPGLSCELGVFMVQKAGETIPCTCRSDSGMTYDGTAF